jgi:hypothetical protein
MIAAGAHDREIGAAPLVAATTVKTHVQHVLRKLHARNRAEAEARYESGDRVNRQAVRIRIERRALVPYTGQGLRMSPGYEKGLVKPTYSSGLDDGLNPRHV